MAARLSNPVLFYGDRMAAVDNEGSILALAVREPHQWTVYTWSEAHGWLPNVGCRLKREAERWLRRFDPNA
ncbi:hypothetical protein [Phenylobacterium sp.]|uniref:hypothetical protein n=1 Tax=Phenylobacterium sp. TaxID=1871053 RepID=UPI003956074D